MASSTKISITLAVAMIVGSNVIAMQPTKAPLYSGAFIAEDLISSFKMAIITMFPEKKMRINFLLNELREELFHTNKDTPFLEGTELWDYEIDNTNT